MITEISPFFGTYVGLSPTEDSTIGMSEMKITIQKDGIKMYHADGMTIKETDLPLDRIRKMTDEEVCAELSPGSDIHTRLDGFQTDEGAIFLFVREVKEDEARLVVRLDRCVEIFGITILYDEEQISNGVFDRVIQFITSHSGDFYFPRLAYGGKCEPGPAAKRIKDVCESSKCDRLMIFGTPKANYLCQQTDAYRLDDGVEGFEAMDVPDDCPFHDEHQAQQKM